MSKEEFDAFIDKIRPFIGRTMKIRKYPWQENSEVEIDDLFSELILQKLHNKSYGRECKQLDSYKDLFDCAEAKDESTKLTDEGVVRKIRRAIKIQGRKILMKGDPGVEKSTLMKKITFDWANGDFDSVSLVFFTALKFVKPGEAIESVIVNKTYGLKGLKVAPSKIRKILEEFGSRSLLILDGLDEHAQGQNSDVWEIIRGEKYLNCNIIVTSRPHSTRKVENSFDTIVKVEGFSRESARQYAFRILRDNEKVEQILRFNPTGKVGYEGESGSDSGSEYKGESDVEDESESEDDEYAGEHFIHGEGEGAQNSESDDDYEGESEDGHESKNENENKGEGEDEGAGTVESSFKSRLYKTPMLLSFMCFLAKNDKEVMGFFTKPEVKGLIYYKMIRCMYTMYCEREGKNFDINVFSKIVMSVGELAWKMLFGDQMFRKGDVVREVGPEVFKWGLLIGD